MGSFSDILPFGHSVFVEKCKVEFFAGNLLKQSLFHLWKHRENKELRSLRAAFKCLRNLFAKGYAFVFPRHETVGKRAAAAIGHNVVEMISPGLCRCRLEKIAGYFAIFVASFIRSFNPSGVDVATDVLGGLCRERIVEKIGLRRVPSDKIETQVEIVIESVRRYGRIPHRPPAFFVHFEGGCEVLGLPNHRNRHISHEDCSFKISGLMVVYQAVSEFIRASPGLCCNKCGKPVFADGLPIVFQCTPAVFHRHWVCDNREGMCLCRRSRCYKDGDGRQDCFI